MQSKSKSTTAPICVVAGLLLDSKGRALIAKRSQFMSSPGLWELPGGKIETGELPRDALKRELLEELQVIVSVGAHFARTELVIANRHYSMDAYHCEILRRRRL